MDAAVRFEPVVLFLRMQPSWVLVDDIRRFVEHFCAAACPGADREEQLALATHELVQNAIAYAATPGVQLELEVDRAAARVRVSVSNTCRPEQLDRLRAEIGRVNRHPDPLRGYLDAMGQDPEARGGLGLARVRYEAALDVHLSVDADRVTVHATGPLATPTGTRGPVRLAS